MHAVYSHSLVTPADKGFKEEGDAVIPLIRAMRNSGPGVHKSTDLGRARMESALCSPGHQSASTQSEYRVARPPEGRFPNRKKI